MIFNSAAISAEINEHCAPLSNSMIACLLTSPAIIGTTAVFSKQTAELQKEPQCDAGVRVV